MAVLSIRYKVIISVAVICFFMAAGAFGAYYFMLKLEEKIGYLEDVSKLEESVLEMRRFEKNYFLYKDRQSLLTALYHLDRARTILERNLGRFETLCPPPQVTLFREDLSNYGRLMSSCDDESTRPALGSPSDVRPECESKTRKIGASLATFAESVIRQKRQSIKETLHTTVQLQLLAFGIVAGGLMATGGFLITKVLKPLRRLEENTERIAKGCFEPIDDLPP
ncbi:MAG: hypothetical protein V2B18_22840, partial [Pseudomonadota bacterium]